MAQSLFNERDLIREKLIEKRKCRFWHGVSYFGRDVTGVIFRCGSSCFQANVLTFPEQVVPVNEQATNTGGLSSAQHVVTA